ncbi:MAG: hypothetical protein KC503_24640, partial [Myxococcales bacterium]|nr:hypothetical protein [Myxococcales bacterium]
EPWWSPAALAPLPPIPGWSYGARASASPRELGLRAARYAVSALMLADLGVSPAQASWARAGFGDLVNRCYGVQIDWRARYRTLLERWTKELSPSYWASERAIDVLHRGLWSAEHDGLSAGYADAWLSRFERDRVGAARAFWSELCAGISDAFM